MKSTIFSVIFMLSFLALLMAGCATSADITDVHFEVDPLQQQWAVNIGEAIGWPPVYIQDRLVILPANSPLMALEAENGQIDWQLDTPAIFWGESLSATLDDFLLAGENGRLLALRPKSGIREWEVNLDGDVLAPPYLDRYVLFTPTSEIEGSQIKNAALYALNASTGKTLWLYKTGSQELLTPARGNDLVYVAGNEEHSGTLYALSAAEGLLQWENAFEEQIVSLAASDEIVAVLDSRGTLVGLEPLSGDPLWEQYLPNHSQHLLGWNDLILIVGEHRLETRAGQTGALVWHFEDNGKIIGQPAILGDELVLLNGDGEVISLNIADGKETGRFATGSTTPKGMVIHQNWLYLTDTDGIVYGYANP